MTEYLPAIVNAVLTLIVGVLMRKLQRALKHAEREKAQQAREWSGIRVGMQVMLRNDLLASYQSARQRGKITYDEADTFEAMYGAYHALGENGVMDGIRESFRRFPVGTEDEVYPPGPKS